MPYPLVSPQAPYRINMFTFLNLIFAPLLSFLLLYKYIGLFAIALLSSIALPIPASASLAAAGGFASHGFLNIYAVLGVTLLGSIVGDFIGYFVAWKYGEGLLNKIRFIRRILQSKGYGRVSKYIDDFAPSLIFFSRFLTELSPATNILAGLAKVPMKTFIISAFLGELVYTLVYGLIGFFLGSQWENNVTFIYKFGYIMLVLGLVINLGHVLMYKRAQQKKENSGPVV